MGQAREHSEAEAVDLTTWTARARCDRCGVVRVRGDDLMLRVAVHDGGSEVRFTCPRCGRIQLGPAGERQVAALVDADAPIEWWELPADLDEVHPGAPISDTELAEMARLLEDDDACAAALEELTGSITEGTDRG